MSRSTLPESAADRITAGLTLATVVALVWLIAAVPQESRAAALAAAGTASAQRVHERSAAAQPVVVDYLPAQFKAPEVAPAEPIAVY